MTVSKFLHVPAVVSFLLALCGAPGADAGTPAPIPLPVSFEIRETDAPFTLSSGTEIVAERGNAAAERAAARFRESFVPAPAGAAPANRVVFEKLADPARVRGDPEGYALEISREKIVVAALAEAGFHRALATLRQLLPPRAGEGVPAALPACSVTDFPRFPWRGVMLDSARHFQSPEWIKKLLVALAELKINVLHWHLTDDQGWRVEIRKFPELARVGARRAPGAFGMKPEETGKLDADGRYGGFYTQEEIREIVRFADSLGVEIVPEIEFPGHALAALAAFPRLGCAGGPYAVADSGGVFEDVFCLGNEATYSFFDDVLEEIAELFPGKFVHVGGDECPTTRWRKCPKCRAKIREAGLKNASALQGLALRRVAGTLAENGRRLVGWDEILEGGALPESAVVMCWRGVSYGARAAALGHDVVMTPTAFCYFDYSQARTGEPRSIGGFVPLERVYSFDPAAGVPEEDRRRVLGAEGVLWTEYVPNERRAEYMLAPRIAALAEIAWTPRERLDFDDFRGRLDAQFARWKAADFAAREPVGVLVRAAPGGVVFSPDRKDAPVAYTLDGSAPTPDSPRAEAPDYFVKIPDRGEPVRVRARAVLPDGELGREAERFLNLPKAAVSSTLGTTEIHFPERAADGSRATIYWSDRAARAGDAVCAVFEKPRRARRVRCVTGKEENGGGGDRLQHGVLEISEDGNAWRRVAEFSDGVAEAALPAGTRVKALRLRVTAPQNEWLVVREFELTD